MKSGKACLMILIVLSVAAIISIVHSSKLKAYKLMRHAAKSLKKFKKLTPVLLLIRKKPVVIVIKKNCNHSPFPELGLGGNVFAASHWLPFSPEANNAYSEYLL